MKTKLWSISTLLILYAILTGIFLVWLGSEPANPHNGDSEKVIHLFPSAPVILALLVIVMGVWLALWFAANPLVFLLTTTVMTLLCLWLTAKLRRRNEAVPNDYQGD